MNPLEAIEFINHLEESFPVDQWTSLNIELWPIIRTHMGFDLTEGDVIESKRIEKASPTWLSSRWKAETNNFAGYLKALFDDQQSGVFPKRKAEVLFVADNNTRMDILGRHYHRLCDPFRDAYQSSGLSTEHIEPLRSFERFPRYRSSIYVNEYVINSLSKIFAVSAPSRQSMTPVKELRELFEYVRRESDIGIYMNEHRSLRMANLVFRMTEIWTRILQFIKPKLIYIVLCYNAYGWSVCTAARRLGIPTVELPHGRQDPTHHAYGRWNRCPSNGYKSLPKVFWSWSAFEKRTIDEWAVKTNYHQSFEGGNALMKMWREKRVAFVKKLDSMATKRFARLKGRPVILATPEYVSKSVDLTLATIARAPKEWYWLIRMHPLEYEIRNEELERSAKTLGIANFEIEYPSKWPLYTILQHADAHFTGFSSVIIEAREMGVPSVTMLKHGAIIFQNEIAAGNLKFCEDLDGCIELIRHCLDKGKLNEDATASRPLVETINALHRQLDIESELL